MSEESPKEQEPEGAQAGAPLLAGMGKKNKIADRVLDVIASLLPVGVMMMTNPTIGYLAVIVCLTAGWSVIIWRGWVKGKLIRYIVYGAILVLALILGLLLRGNKSDTAHQTQPITTNIEQNKGININNADQVVINPPTSSPPPTQPVTDPEAAENKYVRVKRVAPPGKGFADAILIEFGVSQLNSDGFAVAVAYDGDAYDTWYGEPDRTDKQAPQSMIQVGVQPEVKNGVLQTIISQPNLTPRKSYYLCIMSRSRELRQPRDMLFFAVEQDTRVLSPKKEVLGHQYQRKE